MSPSVPLLHQRFPALREALPHLRLGSAPTPVRRLPGLSTGAAPLWMKCEGAFGDGGWGGNKVRKLEWLLADALRQGRRTILTVGGLGTNWGLATALYARDQGLHTALALIDQPVDDHVRAQLTRLEQSGATVHFTHTKARTLALAPFLAARHMTGGRLPYFIPPGGSSPIGVLGYVEAALEIAAQVRCEVLPEPSHIVTAVGSGGTAAGLLLGLQLCGLRNTKVVAVVVNDTLRLDPPSLVRLACRTKKVLVSLGADLPPTDIRRNGLIVVRDWLGPAYGHATEDGEHARQVAADTEDLVLEPVYTAKSMAALLALNAVGRLGAGPVLYLDTNGPR
ncbi:pyridoxal-phosphate dependent enzyme [Streptomyces sp. NBC_00513]|uniref:1-aminocyclopropane-1-carboxylate deaminase/D-cysteine desulfhydrase n=1 Tax=unclassified Streptomyces TaxID=2593676 RepID=UPI00225BEC10|nr:pyridoxal-phosphate dependent enzyme [Streptomyces sp. NBC_00424]MCX5071190.1 pyridoxal-phosphate dependent enzyme [Streptomyces sp. NBC_00424]WUD45394.1 pyridoxal-phosphate dependent enzyme [Streptomyces sp. NBC_00513]